MKGNGKRLLFLGSIFIVVFIIWTLLIQKVDVQPLGANGTNVGFATINCWFHKLTGAHMGIYHLTDWLGLVPIFICMIFGCIGFSQLIKRRSLLKVDCDIILLGVYYIIVIFGYLFFEIGLIHWNEKVKEKQVWIRVLVGAASVCIGYIGGIVTFVDYYNAGVLMVLIFYFFRGKKWWCYLGQFVCLWYINFELLGGFSYEVNLLGQTHFIARQGIALFALIPIWLYRGKQGYYSKTLQYIYYGFYPLHLLILGLTKFL